MVTGLVATSIESYTLYDAMSLPPSFPGEDKVATGDNVIVSTASPLTETT